jgi:hypothetical protein
MELREEGGAMIFDQDFGAPTHVDVAVQILQHFQRTETPTVTAEADALIVTIIGESKAVNLERLTKM